MSVTAISQNNKKGLKPKGKEGEGEDETLQRSGKGSDRGEIQTFPGITGEKWKYRGYMGQMKTLSHVKMPRNCGEPPMPSYQGEGLSPTRSFAAL